MRQAAVIGSSSDEFFHTSWSFIYILKTLHWKRIFPQGYIFQKILPSPPGEITAGEKNERGRKKGQKKEKGKGEEKKGANKGKGGRKKRRKKREKGKKKEKREKGKKIRGGENVKRRKLIKGMN